MDGLGFRVLGFRVLGFRVCGTDVFVTFMVWSVQVVWLNTCVSLRDFARICSKFGALDGLEFKVLRCSLWILSESYRTLMLTCIL